MKKIQILGTGCPKCKKLYENTTAAIELLDNKNDYEIEKVTDIMKIMKFDIIVTPAIAIDGNVVSSGKALSVEDIKEMIK